MLPSPDVEIFHVHFDLNGLSALLLQLAAICHSPGEYSSFSDDVALDKCDLDVNEYCLDNFGNMIIGLFNILKEHCWESFDV
jgi:hypothetical protein